MIGSGLLCLVFGHDFEYWWDDAYGVGVGPAEVEVADCGRCEYAVPTGRDRQADR